mmetsp:Transcript_96/g.167  ORF Transcript_96/g.167 Transcript_96/m.167 type:complete len:173 (-) Transcript_96:339-857(-)
MSFITIFKLYAFFLAPAVVVSGYAFVPSTTSRSSISQSYPHSSSRNYPPSSKPISSSSSSTCLQMIDQNVIMGAGIALAGVAAGIGMVAFTENQGERAKQRGGGLSDIMATNIAGSLMEDVEVSSIKDIGSLTSQLENALKESGGINDEKIKDIEMTEEEKKKLAEELDDGW